LHIVALHKHDGGLNETPPVPVSDTTAVFAAHKTLTASRGRADAIYHSADTRPALSLCVSLPPPLSLSLVLYFHLALCQSSFGKFLNEGEPRAATATTEDGTRAKFNYKHSSMALRAAIEMKFLVSSGSAA